LKTKKAPPDFSGGARLVVYLIRNRNSFTPRSVNHQRKNAPINEGIMNLRNCMALFSVL
jgi:hypothetical protein